MEALLHSPYIGPVVAIPLAPAIAEFARAVSARAESARVAAPVVVVANDAVCVLSSAPSAAVGFPHSAAGAASLSSWVRHPAGGEG